jgi:tripartite-type tricarboxylate transporter receptor subunit TctC
MRQQVERLEDETHAVAAKECPRRIVEPRDIDVVEDDAAGVGDVEAGDQVEQRRLADSGLAHDGDELAAAKLERDVAQDYARAHAPVRFRDAFELQHEPYSRGRKRTVLQLQTLVTVCYDAARFEQATEEIAVKSSVLQGLCAAAALLAGPGTEAQAQGYPARPVRLIIPFSAGGAADVPGRILADRLTPVLGQQVVIENRPGAGSTIGAETAARAAPDGYTLFMISNTHFVSAGLYRKLAYDSLNDYTPVTQVTSAPNVLIVHPSLPAKNVKELIALAKSKPGQINYASSGNGSTQHLTGALFSKMAGISMTHIPYRGSGPVTADLLAGQVQVGFPGIAGMLPHIKSGKLRALGVTESAAA